MLLRLLLFAGCLIDPSTFELRPIQQPPADSTHDVIGSDSVYVSVIGDRVKVSDQPVQRSIGKIPRQVSAAIQHSISAVAPVNDGWLVGTNGGEFGGELFWIGRAGGRAVPVSFPATKAADDPFGATNVVALMRFQGSTLAFVGVDHLGGRSGRLFAVRCGAGQCTTRLVALLDGAPRDWIVTGDRLLVLTGGGIWELLSTETARPLYMFDDAWWVRPTSFARTDRGVLYVAMEHYVLRLEQQNGTWTETWFESARW